MKKLTIAVAMLITAIGIAVWSGIIFKNEMAALSSSLERASRHGTSRSPASFAARSRRSPAISS